jgi:WD40 repeat protein
VVSLRFLADGHLLATASRDGFVRVWNLARAIPGEPEVQLDETEDTRKAVLAPDGRTLAVASAAQRARVRLVDAATGDPRAPALEGFDAILDLAFSADGRLLATGSAARTARVWDVARAEPVSPAVAHEAPVSRVVFSPDSRIVATAGHQGDRSEVRVWDARTGVLRFEPLLFRGAITALQFSDDGGMLLTMSAEASGNLALWQAAAGRLLARATHAIAADKVTSAAFGRGSANIWSLGDDQQIRRWGVDLKEASRPELPQFPPPKRE